MTEQEILRKLLVDLFLASPRKPQRTKQRDREETSKQASIDFSTEQEPKTGDENHGQHSQA